MAERLANIGYLGIKKETTKGTAVTPNVYIPLYDETFMTDVQLDLDNPIVGNKADIFQTIQGQRKHSGEITILAEPNTAGYILDMFMTKGTTTGAGPYTHPFTISPTTDPKSYTIDIQKGQVVARFAGCEVSEVSIDFDTNKMVFKIKFSALSSFIVREISGVSTNVVTFKTNYDATPTTGLVASDLVRVYDVSAGTFQDFTITSVTATTATLSGSPTGIVSGDLFFLRPATPSYTLKTPFQWAKTEFRFAADASTALSATQVRIEKGSKWTIQHMFANDEGEARSGAYDPAALVRTQSHAEAEVKRFFDNPDDMNNFLTNAKKALVIRHYSEDTTYELRITLNNLKWTENPTALKTGEILFSEGKLVAQYDSTDTQQFDVKLLNNVSTI